MGCIFHGIYCVWDHHIWGVLHLIPFQFCKCLKLRRKRICISFQKYLLIFGLMENCYSRNPSFYSCNARKIKTYARHVTPITISCYKLYLILTCCSRNNRTAYNETQMHVDYCARGIYFVRGIYRLRVDSTRKGLWREALMFSFICAWTNVWANNRNASDLRRHRTHYDVTVMSLCYLRVKSSCAANGISRENYINAMVDGTLIPHSADRPIKLSGSHRTQTQTSEVRFTARSNGHWVVASMFA